MSVCDQFKDKLQDIKKQKVCYSAIFSDILNFLWT